MCIDRSCIIALYHIQASCSVIVVQAISLILFVGLSARRVARRRASNNAKERAIYNMASNMLHNLTPLKPVKNRRPILAFLLPLALCRLRSLRRLGRWLLPLHRRGLDPLYAAVETQIDVFVQLCV